MTITSSGPLYLLGHLNAEFGKGGSLKAYYGVAPGIPASGQISLFQFYGKSAAFTFNQTISVETHNYNLRSAAVAAGWDQVKPLIATVTVNNFVGATAGNNAFDTGASYPAGSSITVVNNHWIVGFGGNGGSGGTALYYNPNDVQNGGHAFIASCPCTLYNNGVICAGGGGGAGTQAFVICDIVYGSGGGGGNGVVNGQGGWAMSFPGQPGNYYAGGAGGATAIYAPGAGGSYGSAGGASQDGCNGGQGGYAVLGNGNISWAASGTRYGTIG